MIDYIFLIQKHLKTSDQLKEADHTILSIGKGLT